MNEEEIYSAYCLIWAHVRSGRVLEPDDFKVPIKGGKKACDQSGLVAAALGADDGKYSQPTLKTKQELLAEVKKRLV